MLGVLGGKMSYIKGSKSTDLKRTSFDMLLKKFQKCHDEIWEGGKRDPAVAFDEFTKLLIVKIYDERITPINEEYKFQFKKGENEDFVAKKIREIYDEVKKRNLEIFKVDIKLPDNVISNIVKNLQGISLQDTDLDIKGRAFEKFLGKVFRDENGQYFTPRTVVKFMVDLLDPDENDIIIDPACGSGGFLLHSLMNVTNKISNEYNENESSLNKISEEFSSEKIFGIEINDKIARIAMMDMILHDDGHNNIECNNALNEYEKFESKRSIMPNKYSLLLTNPPFGAIVKDENLLKNFELYKGNGNQKTEILFIERCLDLLKKDGRMGIVLPDSILTNSSLQYVRNYIFNNSKVLAVISIPQHAFVPSGAGVKSSLLFLEKENTEGKDYDVFMATTNHIGFDSFGKEDINDFMEILMDWKSFKEGNTDLKKSFIVKSYELHDNLSPDKFIFDLNHNGWETKDLNELCNGNVFTGKTPAKKLYTEEGYKILKVRDLTNKGIDWDKHERAFVSRQFFKKSPKLQENDILFISSAHHPKYIGKKIDIIDSIPDRYKNGITCSTEIMVLRINPKIINPYYVLLFLKSESGYKSIQSCIRGQTAHIYPKDIKNIKIPIPSKEELELIEKGLNDIKNYLNIKTDVNEKYVKGIKELISFIDEGGV